MAASTGGRPAGDNCGSRVPQGGQGFGDERDSWLMDLPLQEIVVERGSDGEQKFVLASEQRGGLEDRRQVHADFLDAAAGHQGDPLFCRVEAELCRIVTALDGRLRQFRERMADEGRIHAAVAIELFLEREDDEGLVDVVADASARAPDAKPRIVGRHSRPWGFRASSSHGRRAS